MITQKNSLNTIKASTIKQGNDKIIKEINQNE